MRLLRYNQPPVLFIYFFIRFDLIFERNFSIKEEEGGVGLSNTTTTEIKKRKKSHKNVDDFHVFVLRHKEQFSCRRHFCFVLFCLFFLVEILRHRISVAILEMAAVVGGL